MSKEDETKIQAGGGHEVLCILYQNKLGYVTTTNDANTQWLKQQIGLCSSSICNVDVHSSAYYLNPEPRLMEACLGPCYHHYYIMSKDSRSLALALGVSTKKLFMSLLPILYTSHPTSNGKQESILNYMSGTFCINFLTFTKNSIFKCLLSN